MSRHTIRTYCTLCGVGCPSAITVDGDRVLALQADKTHPQGGHVCSKGRAAPDIHDHPHRVNHPLRRTRPKTDPDPGWQRISWDEALDLVASRLAAIKEESGAHALAIGRGTGSGTGLSPAEPWVRRFANTFGTPNYLTNTHLCNWARDGATTYTFGVYPLPVPEVAHSGCVVLWGTNPTSTLLSLGTDVVAARARGARLLVIDPRRVGLANKADLHLAVRPGTDGALALAFLHVLIESGRYDEEFVRQWTNAPLLVRTDTDRLLRAEDVEPARLTTVTRAEPAGASTGISADTSTGTPTGTSTGASTDTATGTSTDTATGTSTGDPGPEPARVAVAAGSGDLVEYVPSLGRYAIATDRLSLAGSVDVPLADGTRVACRPVLALLAEQAGAYPPEVAERITGVAAADIREAVRLMAEHRPTSHYAWNGIVQHTNASQAGRAIEVFFALLGDWDRKGGNVQPSAPRTRAIPGPRLPAAQEERRLGRAERPLGPAASMPGNIIPPDLYTSILDGHPYRVRALVAFGGSLLMSGADPLRARRALERLEFSVHADLFHSPTTAYADVLLPAASFLETEHFIVKGGFAQRRRRAVEPRYERRPDVEIVFELARRLGMADAFAGGDVAAAYDEVLAPAGATWSGLLDHPHGLRVAPPPTYRKYARENSAGVAGVPTGFTTPSRKVELFLDSWAAAGHAPVPGYEEPAHSPVRTPDLARDYPLVLTNAKKPHYLHSQLRQVAALRRLQPDPTVEIHPDTAREHGIRDGQWVAIETPHARVRAKADVTSAIARGVVCAFHGWWEACEPLGLPASDPFDAEGGTSANVNLLVTDDLMDPIGGSTPQRSSLCRVVPLTVAGTGTGTGTEAGTGTGASAVRP